MYSHQDWNRINFQGATGKPKRGEQAVNQALRRGDEVETIRKNTGNKNRVQVNNIAKLAEETDVVPVAHLGHDFRMAMQKARVASGLSQADLARRINEKQTVINEYESGRAVPNSQVILKIERALNCRLPRPPKPE